MAISSNVVPGLIGDIANDYGTAVIASASFGPSGSWVEAISSTTRESLGLIIWALNEATTSPANGRYTASFHIGVGPAASEVIKIGGLQISTHHRPGGPTAAQTLVFVPLRVPSGSRIAVKAYSNPPSGGALRVDITVVGEQ